MEWEERGVKFDERDRREKRRAVWQPLLGEGSPPSPAPSPAPSRTVWHPPRWLVQDGRD